MAAQHPALNGTLISSLPPPGLKDLHHEEDRNNLEPEVLSYLSRHSGSRNNGTDGLTNSRRLWQQEQDGSQLYPEKNPSIEQGEVDRASCQHLKNYWPV